MLTATQFWTEKRREELRAWRARLSIGGGWRPANLKRFKDSTNSGGTPIEKGPHVGFRFHEAWPDGMNYMEAKRSGDKKLYVAVDNHGWYTDSFQDGVIYACAVQVRIPRRRAKREGVEHSDSCYDGFTRVRWMEATAHSGWDQILIGRRSSDLHDTLKECIRSADRVAEMAAEEAREEDKAYQAEQQIEQARHEVKEMKASIHDLISEIKLQRMNPGATGLTTAEALRDALCRGLAEIRKDRKRIALLEREPWQAVA